MPQTPASRADGARTQRDVRTSAVKIEAAARQILIDLAHGRLVPSSGRLIAAEVIVLCEAIAVAQKAAAMQRGEAAA